MIVRGVTLRRRELRVGMPGVSVGEGRAKMPETEFGRGGLNVGWELENISAEEMQPRDWEGRERQRWSGEAKCRGGIRRGCAIGVREFPTGGGENAWKM